MARSGPPRMVVVTGAGGFVGSEVCAALHHAGHTVVAIDQVFDPACRARLRGLRLVDGVLPEVLAGLVDVAPDTVIHGAAITASPEQLGLTRAAHLRRNLDGLTAMLDWARKAGADRFVFLSSMGVFAPQDGPAPGDCFTEATVATGECAYGAAKRAGEILTASAAEPGFATLSLRLGNIFGPHETVRDSRQTLCLAARMIAEARAHQVITLDTPKARREWAWLPDLAQSIAQGLMEFPAATPAVLHAGTPPRATDLDLARTIAELVHGTTIRIAAPPHPAIRPPMASAHVGPFDQSSWTPIRHGLSQLIPERVPS